MSLTRRTLALSVAALSVAALAAGCGFHPVYAPGSRSDAALLSIYVDIIANRQGQLLRQALQQRLEGSGAGAAKRYVLTVFYGETPQALGTQADNSTTRQRDIGTATWVLRSQGAAAIQLTSGHVRSVDGFNVIAGQFFYSDLSEEAAQHRLAEAVADQITLTLGVFFRKHPELG